MYKLPVFNTVVYIWRGGGAFPPVGPADVSALGNLTPGRRILLKAPTAPTALTYMQLLLPMGTDIRSTVYGASADVVEAPAGSGRFYDVEWVDNSATGFANQHILAVLKQHGPWSPPIPPPPPGGWTDAMADSNGTFIPPHSPSVGTGGYTIAPNTAGTGTLGLLWIQSNKAVVNAVSSSSSILENEALVYFDPALASYTLTVDFGIDTAFGSEIHTVVRYDPLGGPCNGYIVVVDPGGIQISIVSAGALGSVVASSAISLAYNTNYTLTIVVTPTTIAATIGATTITATTSSYAGNTKIAIGVANSGMGNDNTYFKSLSVS